MTKPIRLLASEWIVISVWVLAAPLEICAQSAELHGIVRDQLGSPVSDAIVVALHGQSVAGTSFTNVDGRFSISLSQEPIDSIVVSRTGFAKFSTKILASPVEIWLTKVAEIAPVIVSDVQRERPRRRALAPEIGGDERRATLQSNVSGDNSGSYASTLAMSLGYSAVVDASGNVVGLSALGLARQQNAVTLDGIRYDPRELPRDAPILVRAATSTYNATRGGFSGASIAITTPSSLQPPSSSVRIGVETKYLQAANGRAPLSDRRFSEVRLSGTKIASPFSDRTGLILAFQASAREQRLPSIFFKSASELEGGGISHLALDSIANAASSQGFQIPLGLNARSQSTYSANVLMRVDDAPANRRQIGSTLAARCRKANSEFADYLASPSAAGTTQTCSIGSSTVLSRYLHDVLLNETRVGFSAERESRRSSDDVTTSVVRLPATGVSAQESQLSIGGSPLLPYRSLTKSAELTNTTTWHSLDSRHRTELQSEMHYDYVLEQVSQDRNGTVTFPSATAFSKLQPISYHQLISARRGGDEAISGSISFSDEWDLTDDFAFTFGARSDVQSLLNSTAIRSGNSPPRATTVDPRVGFVWGYGTATRAMGPFGTERKSSLRGGFGRFTNLYSAGILQSVTGDTPQREVFCNEEALRGSVYDRVGNFIPAGGCSAAAISSGSREYIDANFRPETSSRASLGWTTRLVGIVRSNIDLLVSRTTNLPSVISTNLLFSPGFVIQTEAGRPVYASIAGIDPTFAVFDYSSTRRDPAFTSVLDRVSDGISTAKQITASISNDPRGQGARFTFSYSLRNIRAYQRGFEGTTAGNPNQRNWERAVGLPRQQASFLGSMPFGLFGIDLFFRASGQRVFTPLIRGDVNGDGLSNDRAFIFPSSTNSRDEGYQITELTDKLPSRLARCLETQRNSIARTGSCPLPIQLETNVAIRVEPSSSRRVSAVASFTNVLALFDALLHGSNHSHGWGNRGIVDPYLLIPAGFDPIAKRFSYRVNTSFGDRSSLLSSPSAVFRSSLELKILTGPSSQQYVASQNRKVVRDDSTARGVLVNRARKLIPDGIPMLLSGSSQIPLTGEQVDRLTELQTSFLATVDSAWAEAISYALRPASTYDPSFHARLVKTATDKSYVEASVIADAARRILTKDQIRILPNAIARLLDSAWVRNSRPRP